jgi:hypothetical protein
MRKVGDVIRCGLKGCSKTFTLRPGKLHQHYCNRAHRYRAWFQRTYVKRENAR